VARSSVGAVGVAVPCRRRPSWLRLAESLRCSRALCCRAVGQLARSLSALRLAPSRSRSRHRASSWPNLARSRRRPLAAALAAVLRLALAAGFLVVLSVSLQLSPLVRLLLSALWCWVAGLLWGVGSVASALHALAATVSSGWLLDERLLLSVAAGLGALARCRGIGSLAGSLPLLSSVGLPRCSLLLSALLHGCWALLALLGFWALLAGRRGSVRCLYQSRTVGARRERLGCSGCRTAGARLASTRSAPKACASAGLGLGIGGRESVSGLSSTGKDRSGEQADERTYPGLVSRRQFANGQTPTSDSTRLPKGQRRQTKPQIGNVAHDPNRA